MKGERDGFESSPRRQVRSGPLAWAVIVTVLVALAGSCEEPGEDIIESCVADPASECSRGSECGEGFACDAERCICENLACFADPLARCSNDLDCPDSSCNLIACRCESEVNAGVPPGAGGGGAAVGTGGSTGGAGGQGGTGGATGGEGAG